ncbi:MAG TPA: DUF2339 domain-containing protein [Myxococcales bacterium]|nr:DUF2339 domain-containing protein [Myxococcales bacterium]
MTTFLFLALVGVVVYQILLRGRHDRLNREVEELTSRLDSQSRRLSENRAETERLSKRLAALEGLAPPSAGELRAPAPAAAAAQARAAAEKTPPPEAAPRAPEPAPAAPPVAAPTAEIPAVPAPLPATPPLAPALAAAVTPVEAPATPPARTIPEPPLPPRAPPRPPSPPPRRFDWEQLVGVKLFSWIAGIALVFAAIFFLRYSIQEGWLGPPIRMAIGLIVGAGLLVASEWKGRRYAVTANALDAASIAILFSTIFAANALWHLLSQLPTFGLMVLITAVAVLLSLRHDSPFVALLGLVGGFATPILLSTGEDKPIGLFTYLLILDAGLAWVAYRKRWSLLLAASLAFTTLYQWGWVAKFVIHKPAELPLAAAVFMVFPIFMALAYALGGRAAPEGKRGGNFGLPDLFDPTLVASAALPLLFALCMAAVPAFGERYLLLFGYLLLVDLGLAALAIFRKQGALHGGAGFATLVTFAGWLAQGYPRADAWPWVLGCVAPFVLLYAGLPLLAKRLGRPLDRDGERAALAAPLLLFVFPVLAYVEPATAHPAALFAALFLLMACLAAAAILLENGPLHFIAAFFAVAAEAVWSAKHLAGPAQLTPALAIYALFGLFYVGVPTLARRFGRRLRPEGSGAVLLFASLALLLFLAAGPVAHTATALWGMGLLLALLNLGLFFDVRTNPFPILTLLGVALSWVVIAIWWATAMVTALLVPALVIVTGFALLILAGNVWVNAAQAPGEARGSLRQGLYLGLVGHAFLAFVASRPDLAVPPWALFGVLAVLDLAIFVAALFARKAELHLAALLASQAIVLEWLLVARDRASAGLAWTEVAVLAAGALAAFGLAALPLARRRGATSGLFLAAAAGGVYAFQLLLATAAALPEAPALRWLAPANALALLAFAWLAWPDRLPLWLAALLLPSVSLFDWEPLHFAKDAWTHELAFAAVPYLMFNAYPIALGARARRSLLPALAAVLASAPFFFAARHALTASGHAGVIGVLPVGEAVILMGLLVYFLRLEPRGERNRDRLALLAGAALGFITAAIPLQLENEWVTIGWALESAGLAWLYLRLDHKGLLAASAALAAAVVVRLSLNRAVLEYHARGAVRIWNWYLYTYLVAALALLAGAWILAGTDDRPAPRLPRTSTLQASGGTLLLFLLVNIEIADWFSTGREITFNFSSTLGQDVTYTLGWAAFAVALLAVGVVLRSKAARIAALALLVVTMAKCFLHDLWRLGGLYRVGSFVALALCLALVAIVLQKFVLAPEPPPAKEAA